MELTNQVLIEFQKVPKRVHRDGLKQPNPRGIEVEPGFQWFQWVVLVGGDYPIIGHSNASMLQLVERVLLLGGRDRYLRIRMTHAKFSLAK